jgi:Xaa-Pro aminopeptidase
MRRPVEVVEGEIAAAREAQRVAKHEARKALHEEQRGKREADVHAKVEELKAKLPAHKGPKESATASASG